MIKLSRLRSSALHGLPHGRQGLLRLKFHCVGFAGVRY
jgi:hypothetical protein